MWPFGASAHQRQRSTHLAAIDKPKAIIAFDLDGTAMAADQNFLDAASYPLNGIIGGWHPLFVSLRCGDHQAGASSGGSPRAGGAFASDSDSPTFDLNGKPCKVVKDAPDIHHRLAEAAHP